MMTEAGEALKNSTNTNIFIDQAPWTVVCRPMASQNPASGI
jgi:hypothetical protein